MVYFVFLPWKPIPCCTHVHVSPAGVLSDYQIRYPSSTDHWGIQWVDSDRQVIEFAFGVGSPSTLRKPQAHPFLSSLESGASQGGIRLVVPEVRAW